MFPEFHGVQVQLGQGDAPAGGHGFVPVREAFYRKGVVAEKGGHFLWGKSVHIPAAPKNIFRVDGFSEAPQENALTEAPRQAQAGRHGGNRVSLLPAENLGENSGNFLPAPGIHVVDVECIPGLGRAADVQRGRTGEIPMGKEQVSHAPLNFLSGCGNGEFRGFKGQSGHGTVGIRANRHRCQHRPWGNHFHTQVPAQNVPHAAV